MGSRTDVHYTLYSHNQAGIVIYTVGTKSVRTPERTLWETAVFSRRKIGQIFIRFE